MREQTIKVYKFAELPAKAKRKVIEANRHINIDHPWYEDYIEEVKKRMDVCGFDIDEVFFSGFCSQGDGASWIGSINIVKWIEDVSKNLSSPPFATITDFLSDEPDCSTTVTRFIRHYSHENTMSFDHELLTLIDDHQTEFGESITFGQSFSDDVDRLLKEIECSAKECAKSIYRSLEKIYDELISDKNVSAAVEINEYEFLVDGSPWF
jgi:hypothetical protein